MAVVLEPTEREQAAATRIERADRARVVSRALKATTRLLGRAAGLALALVRGAFGR